MANKNIEITAHELALAFGLLVRKMRSASPSESDLSWTQKSIIVRLDKDGPMTVSELARAEGVKSQSMSTAVASLEEMGYVERRPHKTDARRLNIHLTQDGTSMRKLERAARRTWLADSISQLEKADQEIITKAIGALTRLAEL